MRRSHVLTLVLLVAMAGLVSAGCKTSEPELPVAEPIIVTQAYKAASDHLSRDETLSHLLARHDIDGGEAYQLISAASDLGLNPRRLRPDLLFEFKRRIGAGQPSAIRTRIRPDAYLVLTRDSSGTWSGAVESVDWDISVQKVEGTIAQSLNQSIHEAVPDSVLPYGERDRLIWNTAEAVYGWVIDFTRDIRPGDRFQIVYERLVSSAGEVRYGRVVAARVDLHGEVYSAYVMTDPQGNNVYYDATGRSLHRAFLKYPVQFRRISSVFNRHRFHPILKTYRAHLGYDFAADIGTPIRSTGDGVVRMAGRNGGLGLMVAVRHPKGIETRYGHMSRIASGIRPGVRVTQGQTIGYVGMTGLANGPHVHYEFLKNGRHINYRNVDLGDGDPIPQSMQREFEVVRQAYDLMLDRSEARIPLLIGGE